jgi:hypothetical protein
MKKFIIKIKNYLASLPDKAYHNFNNWMWSRQESGWEKILLDKFNGELVEYEENHYKEKFSEILKIDSDNPDRLIAKYDENRNRIW